MFDWLKKLFGEGVIRLEGTLDDGTEVTAKMPYIGSIDTMVEEDVIETSKNQIYVKYGKRVRELRITGWY